MAEETCVEMDKLGQNGVGERENESLLEVQSPDPPLDTKVEKWVGIHSLRKMPKQFKPQESSTVDYFPLIECIRAQQWKKPDAFRSNQMTILFCSPGINPTVILKETFYLLKKSPNPNPNPRYKIIFLDARNPDNLTRSFEKIANIKADKDRNKEHLWDAETVDDIYKDMSRENGPKNQSLFVFVGAKSFEEIKQFLPQTKSNSNCLLPFSQFLVTTCSKTESWASEELNSEKWSVGKFLLFDTKLIPFDFAGVYSAPKLPASIQPVPDFSGRNEVLSKLADNFQSIPRVGFPAPSGAFTVVTGVSGIGKTELVKKFLWTHPHFFSKVIVFDASNPLDSLKVFAHNSGIYTESEIEGETDADKSAFLDSQIIKNVQENQKVLFVFDNANSLIDIKNYLPNTVKRDEIIFHVIVTSRSRNWEKEDDIKFYRDNKYDFQEIPLFDGLSLEETHEFCSKILPKNGILYNREDLERSIRELHKLGEGHPSSLQNLTKFVSESSRTNSEWSPKLHILSYLCRIVQEFRRKNRCFPRNGPLLEILCLMNPEHLDFDMICYFYFEYRKPFKPPPQQYGLFEIELVQFMLRNLEMDSIIQVDRTEDGTVDKVRIPAFVRESVNESNAAASILLDFLLNRGKFPSSRPSFSFKSKSNSNSNSTWTRPLDFPRLWPHILSLNECHTRRHGYYNHVLIQCIRNHLDFWRKPPKDEEIPEEERPDTDYEKEKEKIKKLLKENPDFKTAFGDFSQVDTPPILLPLFFLTLFVVDFLTDCNNVGIMWKAGYIPYSCLALVLVCVPYWFLSGIHYVDRAEYKKEMRVRQSQGWSYEVGTIFGTFYSFFSQFWYTWKFWSETENLEKGLLYERLCVLRANAEYQGLAEAFLESLPQLLLQFPLYLLSYTKENFALRKVMRGIIWREILGSLIPFELGLVVSLFSFGLALTKRESVYFGWNMELFGIKLLGYRSIHLLLNFTHVSTLVFCTGIISMAFPSLIFVIPLVFFLTATAWIFVHPVSSAAASWRKSLQTLFTFFAPFHPAYVEKGTQLEFASKHEFVSARLGHDLLFLQRCPRKSDIIYLLAVFSSILISLSTAIYCTFFEHSNSNLTLKNTDKNTDTDLTGSIWIFQVIQQRLAEFIHRNKDKDLTKFWTFKVIQQHSFYFILWLPLLFMWQVLRQLLNNVYLKYAKAPPLTEDYILNDPDGIIRYPVDSKRWIHHRLYYQMRQNRPSVFHQTWTQVKGAAKKFRKKNIFTQLKTVILILFKFICKVFYFLLMILLLSSVPYNVTRLKVMHNHEH